MNDQFGEEYKKTKELLLSIEGKDKSIVKVLSKHKQNGESIKDLDDKFNEQINKLKSIVDKETSTEV